MKALTLHQPWASLVALGVKTIETRSWATSYRGPLAIHAATRWPVQGAVGGYFVRNIRRRDWPTALHYSEMLWENDLDERRPFSAQLPLGAVVATCELVDVAWTTMPGKDGSRSDIGFNIWDRSPQPFDEETARIWALSENGPYGDFSPGRYAWLLADIKALDEPVPATGHQGLWEWAP